MARRKKEKAKLAYTKAENKTIQSRTFLIILSIVSILGFFQIVMKNLFDHNITPYIEVAWMVIIGLGFMIEVRFRELINIKKKGLTPENFSKLVTILIGLFALLAGFLSIPQFNITNSGFLAVKGILALIAIVIIFIQTWVSKK